MTTALGHLLIDDAHAEDPHAIVYDPHDERADHLALPRKRDAGMSK